MIVFYELLNNKLAGCDTSRRNIFFSNHLNSLSPEAVYISVCIQCGLILVFYVIYSKKCTAVFLTNCYIDKIRRLIEKPWNQRTQTDIKGDVDM